MAKTTVYIPDELLAAWKAEGGGNLSHVVQLAITEELFMRKAIRKQRLERLGHLETLMKIGDEEEVAYDTR